ncbi:MAG: HGxxPAAW family protein [Marmoricola sp.]
MSDNHGNTPAAWTAVVVALAGFVVGGIGLMVSSMAMFWIGVALAPVALIVLAAMTKMGYGTIRH